MWVSNYNIYIALPRQQEEEYLLVHGYTGAIDVVDVEVVNLLKDCHDKHEHIPTESIPADILHILEQRGYLTELSPQEELGFVQELARKIHEYESRKYEFWIIPSYACQLACPYCYERPAQRRGKSEGWLKKRLVPSQVDRIFEMIGRFPRENIENQITLFGGEPLLHANRNIIVCILKQTQIHGFQLVSFTNAVELDSYADLLGRDSIEELHVTLDGPRLIHDRSRIYKNGTGTFDRIVENINVALGKGVRLTLRINVSWKVLPYLDEMFEIAEQNKWNTFQKFHMYFESIRGDQDPSSSSRFSNGLEERIDNAVITKSTMTDRDNQYSTTDLHAFGVVDALLSGKIGVALRASHCSGNRNWRILDPLGNMYPCTESVGNLKYCIGTYLPDLEDNQNTKYWHSRTIDKIPACQNCPYSLFCGGGCTFQSMDRPGEFMNSCCSNFPARFEAALLTRYKGY